MLFPDWSCHAPQNPCDFQIPTVLFPSNPGCRAVWNLFQASQFSGAPSHYNYMSFNENDITSQDKDCYNFTFHCFGELIQHCVAKTCHDAPFTWMILPYRIEKTEILLQNLELTGWVMSFGLVSEIPDGYFAPIPLFPFITHLKRLEAEKWKLPIVTGDLWSPLMFGGLHIFQSISLLLERSDVFKMDVESISN